MYNDAVAARRARARRAPKRQGRPTANLTIRIGPTAGERENNKDERAQPKGVGVGVGIGIARKSREGEVTGRGRGDRYLAAFVAQVNPGGEKTPSPNPNPNSSILSLLRLNVATYGTYGYKEEVSTTRTRSPFSAPSSLPRAPTGQRRARGDHKKTRVGPSKRARGSPRPNEDEETPARMR